MRAQVVMLAAAVALGGAGVSFAQTFHADDPMRRDDDRLIDVREEPAEVELSDLYDRFGHIFHMFGDPPFPAFVEAQNVNTLDEVPDSSWFVNRNRARRLTLDEVRRGSNVDGPPDLEGTWTIFAGKSQGITPGFSIRDARGDRYVVKFDPVAVPELATAAEAIGTKIFHALGYHVPQNYVVYVNPEKLAIEPDTMVEDRFGDAVPLTGARLQRMIRRVPRDARGRMRVLASRYIDGVPLGPFRYYGTRSDDPNDVIPHEHRRELRGLRLFAAWTNHDDTRAQNTQASWVEEEGRHHVRHWLMDFGSTFGSGSVEIQLANLGVQYWLDPGEVKRNALGFGFRVPPYRRVRWPDFPEYEAVGRWEADAFDPFAWRNDYPNPAFVRMTPRDAFWAAKILMRLTPEALLAIVETGAFSNPAHVTYFHDVLLRRQRAAGQAGINLLNPLDEFVVSDNILRFENLSERYGFVAPQSTSYEVAWALYDNAAGRVGETRGRSTGGATTAPLPEAGRDVGDRNLLLRAEIVSRHPDHPDWARPVRVYLRSNGRSYEVIAIDRESDQRYIDMS